MTDLVPQLTSRAIASAIANQVAQKYELRDYLARKSTETLRRQTYDLKLFASYLKTAGIDATGIALDVMHHKALEDAGTPISLEGWSDVSYGLIQGFVRWQLLEGYAVHSVNIRLSTVKQYCYLATKSGVMPATELAMIKLITSYRETEGKNIDKDRPEDKRRRGAKKATATTISKEQIALLKQQPDTPQGRRDQLLVCLLLDHGLRCGEIAALQVNAINITEGTMTFHRPKVDKMQSHNLTRDTLVAASRYLEIRTGEHTQLVMGSTKDGSLIGGMKVRAITARVNTLGKGVDIENLSAHDGRHTWATRAAKAGTHIKALQDAGGWNSIAMPMRYIESQTIANEGVKLD